EWLNEINDVDILTQRTYDAPDDKRYIFTFVDSDGNMVAGAGKAEQVEFSALSLPSTSDLTDTAKIFPYIQPFAPFTPPGYLAPIAGNAPAVDDYLKRQTQRVINFVRGADQGEYTSATYAYTIPAFRSRQIDYDKDGAVETWRLGDVIHSTPTVIGRPSENYDLLYHDLTYSDFYNAYENRRSMVYFGGNDGMFHALNGGFYDPDTKAFLTQPLDINGVPDTSFTAFDLGSEIWAYVPFNLLPHLHWLTDPDYNHIYYCDLKPKVFDAKIFPFNPDDGKHINGWGTILVGGMRLGGGKIQADMDKTDMSAFSGATDQVMSSAYFVLDVTDPESEPVVLAEFAFPNLGFTTSYPTVIPMRHRVVAGDGTITFDDPGAWYLVIGSGPANASGETDSTALADVTSKQFARLFVVDLVKLGTDHQLWTLDSAGTLVNSVNAYATLNANATTDANAFISDIISVDFDLDYNTDALYFGTISGDKTSGWGGKLRRIYMPAEVHPEPPDPAEPCEACETANWTADSTLIDLSPNPSGLSNGQPIEAAPSIAIDAAGSRWVFFGTGRFFNRDDASNADQQSYYGIKEPSGVTQWNTVSRADLLDVSNAVVFEDGADVDGVSGVGNWEELLTAINGASGWLIDFPDQKERNLGQATLLGDILTFTTYIPSVDACEFEGVTYLYATYYNTGTAFTSSVIGLGNDEKEGKKEVLRRTSLGKGLSVTPNIHTGRESGSKVFVQTSTGAIEVLEEANPGMTKSGRLSWEEE
ncbi:MAG: hypothetical protein ABII06_05345, partial [Pseudomonadota bacterium]